MTRIRRAWPTIVAAIALASALVPLPARAASPTGAPNDPFMCYKGSRDSQSPRFSALFFLPIDDPLANGTFDVRKRRGLCNPADREDAGIVDAATHLLAYGVRASSTAATVEKHDVLVLDQLGTITLTTRKPDRLLVPSALDPNGPVPPLDPEAHTVNHFLCYRARVAKGTAKFPKGLQTTVVDEFNEPVLLDVKKPSRLCFPASVDGGAVPNPTGHLTCYRVKRAQGEVKHEKRTGLHANNEIESANPDGPAVLKTSRREELCIPAVVVPPTEACMPLATDGGPAADLCTPAAPGGTVYYVATDGDDLAGDGSDATPWATITHAVTQVADGSTILVRPGTYVGRAKLDRSFATGITVRSEVPYQAQLRNSSTVVAAFTGQGITLEGFDIAHDGPGAGPIVVQIQDLRGDPGGDDFTGRITLRNNVIHDSFNNDIVKVNNGAGDITIEGNVFYNQEGDDEHIDLNSVHDVTVRDNVFFNDFAGSGRGVANDTSNFIVIKDTSVGADLNFGSKRIAVRRNVFTSWEGLSGAHFVLVGNDNQTFFGADGVVVENNLMLGNSAHVMRSAIGVNGARCVEVRHNTVAGDLPSLAFALRVSSEGANPPNEELGFRGNIWSDPTGTMEDFSDGPPSETVSFVLDRNLYWNGGAAIPVNPAELVNVTDDAAAVLGDPVLDDATTLVPPRWDPVAGTFADGSTTACEVHTALAVLYGAPGAGSAAIDAGDGAIAPDHDILGNPRPMGAAPDLGAFETP